MTIKTVITDALNQQSFEDTINEIGWENVLQILPDHRYDGTLFVIIYNCDNL